MSPPLEKTFVVYPVDTYGTEYTVNIPAADGYCDVIAIEAGTTLETAQKNAESVYENMELSRKISKEVTTGDGVVFKANRPFALFCGVTSISWNQMLPQYSLGKHYVIPNVDPYNAFQFDTTVKIVATQDNTIIDHGNLGQATLVKRGDATSIQVTFEGTKPYQMISNFPVSVGLLVTETYEHLSTYTILPSTRNFMDYPLAFSDNNIFVVYVDSKGMTNDIWTSTEDDNRIPQNQTYSLSTFKGLSDSSGSSLVVNQTASVLFPNLAEVRFCLCFH